MAGGEAGRGFPSSQGAAPTPGLLQNLEAICAEISEKWDAGQRAGKLLAALEGRAPRYRDDVTKIRAALDAHDDMLAALRAAERQIKHFAGIIGEVEARDNSWNPLLRKIREALAKATGG